MRSLILFPLVLCVAPVFAEKPEAPAPAPAKGDKVALPASESLRYSINWPSGLSLGEGSFKATQSKSGGWELDLALDASIPGFAVVDHYHSFANSELCSESLEKTYQHGRRKASEKTTFDLEKGEATRQSLDEGAGKSTIATGACAHDALTFIQYVRRELALGHLSPQHKVVFGSEYQVRLDYKGPQSIKIGEGNQSADRIEASLKGPQTNLTFEIYFARDGGRTPLLVRVPLTLGAFTMELVP